MFSIKHPTNRVNKMICSLVFTLLITITNAFITPDAPAKLSSLTGEDLVNYINSAQSLFVAEDNDFHTKYSLMQPHYAERKADQNESLSTKYLSLERLPANFDSRSKWPNCKSIRRVRDQDNCGSCWAFAVAEVISDRTCIETRGRDTPTLSPEDILSCCGSQCGHGCHGGYPVEALKWWVSRGVVTGGDYHEGGCRPYSIAPCTKSPCKEAQTPMCRTRCRKGYNKKYLQDKRHGATVYQLHSNPKAIMTDIYLHGPVEASFQVFEDLYKYHSGIYHHVAGKHLGGHAVKIIGWGRDRGEDYWLIANSWGVHFGEQGFMRIRRGTNECGIEGNVLAGRPRSWGEMDGGSGEGYEEEVDDGSAELQFL